MKYLEIYENFENGTLRLLKNNEYILQFNYGNELFDEETYFITQNDGRYNILNSSGNRLDNMDYGMHLKHGIKLLNNKDKSKYTGKNLKVA